VQLIDHISGRRPSFSHDGDELFDLHLASGLSIIGMRLCQNSGKHWIDFPATGYVKAGEQKHFAFLRASTAFRRELNREALELLGVSQPEPRLV
jgi:hypothetical protein